MAAGGSLPVPHLLPSAAGGGGGAEPGGAAGHAVGLRVPVGPRPGE